MQRAAERERPSAVPLLLQGDHPTHEGEHPVRIQAGARRGTIRSYPDAVPRSVGAPSQDHAILFYDDATHAVERLADYAAEGLRQGEAVVAVLTPPHAEALVAAMRVREVEPDVARGDGRLVLLDAASTLRTFLIDGNPDRSLLADGVGAMCARLAEGGRPLRTAGEMVAVLWADGNVAGALALESAWDELADELELRCCAPTRRRCSRPATSTRSDASAPSTVR